MLSLIVVTCVAYVSIAGILTGITVCAKKTAPKQDIMSSKKFSSNPHRLMSQKEEAELCLRLKPRVYEPESEEEKKQIEAIKAGLHGSLTNDDTLKDAHEEFKDCYYISKQNGSAKPSEKKEDGKKNKSD